jgi:hypothetical protein
MVKNGLSDQQPTTLRPGSRWRKRLVLGVSILFATVLTGAVLAQIILHFFARRGAASPIHLMRVWDAKLGMSHPKPSLLLRFSGMSGDAPETIIRTNSWGFRGDEFSPRKTAGIYRVLCFGDSFLFGAGVNNEDTLPHRLVGLWSVRGRRVEAYNFGVAGNNAFESTKLARKICPMIESDAVLFYFNETDLWGISAETSPFIKRLSDASSFFSILSGHLPFLKGEIEQVLSQELQVFRREYRGRPVVAVCGDVDPLLLRVLSARDIPVVDVTAIHTDRRYHISRRDGHLNAAGYAAVAAMVAKRWPELPPQPIGAVQSRP